MPFLLSGAIEVRVLQIVVHVQLLNGFDIPAGVVEQPLLQRSIEGLAFIALLCALICVHSVLW